MYECSLLRCVNVCVQTSYGESDTMQLVAMHEAPGRLRVSSVLILTTIAMCIHKDG
jgi:hypothetical protein